MLPRLSSGFLLTVVVLYSLFLYTSGYIAPVTGLVGNTTQLSVDSSKEVVAIKQYVLDNLSKHCPYLEEYIPSAVIDTATIQLQKYTRDGKSTFTYEGSVYNEQGRPVRVTKEAIFGAYYHLALTYNKPVSNTDAASSTDEVPPQETSEDTQMSHKKSIELALFQDIRGFYSVSKYSVKDDTQQQPHQNTELSILSYNLWNFNSPWARRREMIADEVARLQPDIIGWQEVRYGRWQGMGYDGSSKDRLGAERSQATHLARLLHERGVQYYFVVQPAMIYLQDLPDYTLEGLSFFSKYPIIESDHASLSRDLADHADEHQRICLRALIKTPIGPVNVFVTHMSLSASAQERNVVEILKFADKFEYPQILMGDFNGFPNATAVQFLLGRHTLNGITGNFKDTWETAHNDFVDAHCGDSGMCFNPCAEMAAESTPDSDTESQNLADLCNGFTFNAIDRNPTKRIDFIFTRGTLNLQDFSIIGKQPAVVGDEKIMASDHYGLLVKFKN